MAKGYEIHQARAAALQALGKDLARRAKSKCELTGAAGVPLECRWSAAGVPGELSEGSPMLAVGARSGFPRVGAGAVHVSTCPRVRVFGRSVTGRCDCVLRSGAACGVEPAQFRVDVLAAAEAVALAVEA